jgi:hypothetical protein
MAATEAADAFGWGASSAARPRLYLFGSADSLLKNGNELISAIDGFPYYTHINIGFESFDATTLARFGKPLNIPQLADAFQLMLSINREYANIEISANFLLGEDLPPKHDQALIELLQSVPPRSDRKGAVYLSPLMGTRNKKALLEKFERVRDTSRLPVFVYLIQRLKTRIITEHGCSPINDASSTDWLSGLIVFGNAVLFQQLIEAGAFESR